MDELKAFEFPGVTFKSKRELFLHLLKNVGNIISIKKATIKNSEGCNFPMARFDCEIGKGIEGLKEGNIYPIINTTNIMDSHNDVHLPKIWNKSIKEQKGKVFYVTDHDLKINSVIAFPNDVDVSVKTIKWSDLGKSFEGETQALMFSVSKDSVRHEGVSKIIEEKINIQHSVRMQYVKMFLAVDSDDKEFKTEKKAFDKYIDVIANKEAVIEQGYFWGIQEAKISQEGSMVLLGSNSITPLLHGQSSAESPSGTKQESSKDTQKVARRSLRW